MLTNGGLVNSQAESTGAAGLVQLTGQTVQLSGPGTELSTKTLGSAPGGNVRVDAGQLSLTNGASISTSSTSSNSAAAGNAGNITLASLTDINIRDSMVTTSAAQATGGNIKLSAPGMILMDNAQITSSVNGPVGSNGGNISIDPQFVIMKNGSTILANAVGGNGGNINIVTNTFLAEPGTLIDASSSLGISGQITIQSPIQSLAGAIAPLPQNLVSLANLYGQHCASQKGGQFSSFVQGQRDGLPTQPGDFLSSPLSLDLINRDLRSEEPALSGLTATRLGLSDSTSFSRHALSLTSGCRS
jgi:large exoprotein involved in heme utilization and adhesion